MDTLLTSAVATRLTRELRLKPPIRSPEIEKYAETCGAVIYNRNEKCVGGKPTYKWTEENYQTLKNTIEL